MKTILEGKRILLTRPKNQYGEWASRLSTLGAIPVSFPLIEIIPVLQSDEISKVLANLDEYDWIVFTSTNAAKYFIELLKNNGNSMPGLSIAAIGSKTAAWLEQNGYGVDFMPGIYTAAELAESIPDIKGRKILLPRTDMADDELYSALCSRGAKVDEVIVYNTKKITSGKNELQKLLNEGMDVITFASPSVVEAFWEMGIDKKDALVACIGPVTANKALEKGFKPDIVAESFTADGLTQAIMTYYNSI